MSQGNNVRTERIRAAIEKSGYSYPELAEITGISKSSLQRYATGVTKKIPINCVELIAKATNTTAAYLMGWEEDDEACIDKDLKKPVNVCKEESSISDATDIVRNSYGEKAVEMLEGFDTLNELGKDKMLNDLEDTKALEKYTLPDYELQAKRNVAG